MSQISCRVESSERIANTMEIPVRWQSYQPLKAFASMVGDRANEQRMRLYFALEIIALFFSDNCF